MIQRIALVGLAVTIAQVGWADSLGFGRTCKVYVSPDPKSPVVCTGSPSDNVRSMEKQSGGYYRVELKEQCVGYVTDSCLNLPMFRTVKKEEVRRSDVVYQKFQVAPVVGVGLVLAEDGGGSTLNKGWGYEFGVRVDLPVVQRFRISPELKYVGWILSRDLTSSSAISSPADLVTQTLTYWSAGVMLGYTLGARYKVDMTPEMAGDRTFWVEAGLELLNPLSASQTRNDGAAVEFDNTAKPLLLVAGAGVDWPVTDKWSIGTHLQGFYNLAADNGSKLFGFRAQARVAYGL